jgi:hypothetical protein
MDVAASHWATLQMGPVGPTSEKAAKHMKNTAILVAKRFKNWACEARDQVHQCVLLFFSFSLCLVSFFITPWPLKVLEILNQKTHTTISFKKPCYHL